MSSRIWTTRAVASSATPARVALWRAVEAQHVVSTLALVDSVEEQRVLERLIEGAKPPVPAAASHLHWLLSTPFRYPPPPRGSRFRGPNDPGVFYGGDTVRTACAELGYWRWRHLADSPAIDAMPSKPQTVFRVDVRGATIDLREAPFRVDRACWTAPNDYAPCQAFAVTAREAGVDTIRYESVRDPVHDGCGAVLTPRAFAKLGPLEQQTWMLTVTRRRVVWQRTHALAEDALDFATDAWAAQTAAETRARP